LEVHPVRHHSRRSWPGSQARGAPPTAGLAPQSRRLANDAPTREIVFLGDFIDRGPENAAVIRTVRSLMDAGKARAVMGNHELNALHYHTPDLNREREYLRPHTLKNQHQHAAYLREYPLGARTQEVLGWMTSLTLFLEAEAFRAVHACWDEASIAALADVTDGGVLTEAQIARAVDRQDPLVKSSR
jgi:predicted MPP superfamily phosphohydrolase